MPRWRHSSTSYFGGFEFVFDEFEHRGGGEVGNREDRLEDGLQALVGPAALRLHHQQELVVGRLLNLNEVRHLRDFLDFSEKLPYALPTDKRLRHHVLSLNRSIGLEPRLRRNLLKPSRSRPGSEPRGRGTEAIKATLQKAAIHRDRRDRRQTPYFPPFRAISARSSEPSRPLRSHACSESPGLAPLARGYPLK